MSIYASFFSLGFGDPDDDPGQVSAYTDNVARQVGTGLGNPRTHVGLASIPGYCWPNGNDAPEAQDRVAPWVRLSISAAMPGESVDWPYAAVNIDIEAARSLRDALTEWIGWEHLPELPGGAA